MLSIGKNNQSLGFKVNFQFFNFSIFRTKLQQTGSNITTYFSGITSANALLNNATWLTDYNLPACLSRCKFPKTQDALHELNSNRTKKRTEPNLPPIPPEVAQFAGMA